MKRRFLLLLVALLGLAGPLEAQEPPTLERVEELVGLGRTEEARALLAVWWEEARAGASRRDAQRSLWLRGRLTVDPVQASLDFRRLVIEYPGGPFSDMALLRLAQAAWASGDSVEAVANVDRLAREYPSSPVRREAEAWLATAGPLPEPVTAPSQGTPDEAGVTTGEPAEDPPRSPAATPDDEPRGRFAVQLGAFSSRSRAEALLQRLADAGEEARLVTIPGSDLVRVRVGTFDSAEGAGAILRRLQELGFTAALSRDAHREERVR